MNQKAAGKEKRKGSRQRQFLWSLSIAVGLLVFGGLTVAWLGSGGGAVYSGPTGEARRGDLTISVTESGSLRNRDQVIVTNRVQGRTTLLWVVEEGTEVEEGDLLVELDSSELENELVDSRIEVQNAEADFIRAREQLEVTKSQNASDIAEAELTLRLAKLDFARYLGEQDMMGEMGFLLPDDGPADLEEDPVAALAQVAESDEGSEEEPDGVESAAEGDYAQEREKLISEIDLAREELTRARQQYEDSRELADEGFITELEVEGDRLAMERTKVDLKLARGQLHLLENYTHRRDLEQFRSDLEQAERALKRVKLTANSNLVQAKADYDSTAQEWEEEQRELEEVKEQIAFCEIRAPAAGMVVYETSTNQRRWGNDEPLEAGQEIRERQELIHLPASEGMVADVTVHESALDGIALGMPARVTVDARQGRPFKGTVRRIAPMPDAQSIWLNPDLTVYSTEVDVDAGSRDLRTGMSCRVEIIVEELEDVVFVPLQSVVRYENRHYVYVLDSDGPRAQRVEIGLDNNRVIHIREGIESGETVLLAPPIFERMDAEDEPDGDSLEGPEGDEPESPAEAISASPSQEDDPNA